MTAAASSAVRRWQVMFNSSPGQFWQRSTNSETIASLHRQQPVSSCCRTQLNKQLKKKENPVIGWFFQCSRPRFSLLNSWILKFEDGNNIGSSGRGKISEKPVILVDNLSVSIQQRRNCWSLYLHVRKHPKWISRWQQVCLLYLSHFLQPWQRGLFYFILFFCLFFGRCDSFLLCQITLCSHLSFYLHVSVSPGTLTSTRSHERHLDLK